MEVYYQGSAWSCTISGPIKDAICKRFLPVLFDVPPDFITDEFFIRLTHSVKRSEIGVQNPVDTTPHNFKTLKAGCTFLVNKLIDGG